MTGSLKDGLQHDYIETLEQEILLQSASDRFK